MVQLILSQFFVVVFSPSFTEIELTYACSVAWSCPTLPRAEETGGLQSMGSQESDMT